MSESCKRCGSASYVKNGTAHGNQRYRCKHCGYNYISGDKRVKYGLKDRLKVLKLYLENCGIRTIERLTGIRNSQISQWILESAEDIRNEISRSKHSIKTLEDISILEVDELCTTIKKDPKTGEATPSYGLMLIENQVKLLILR